MRKTDLYYLKQFFGRRDFQWVPWKKRDRIKGIDRKGAYILASFRRKPQKTVALEGLLEEVVYVGEVHGNTKDLKKRLNEFERSASSGKKGHAGGLTFRRKRRREGLSLKKLYLIAFPAPEKFNGEFNLIQQQLFARLIEREILWAYGVTHNHRPICNKD